MINTPNKAIPIDLGRVIDIHVHGAPDVRPRKMTGLQLAYAARQAGLRGFVFKNHQIPTVAQAELIREAVPGVEVFGGIALNYEIGGYNPAAVETALAMGGVIVWMPTLCAEHERVFRGRPGTGLRLLDSNDQLPATVRDILKLVAQHNAVLGTGHFGFEEIMMLLGAARDAGVQRIVVNHPGIVFQRFSIDQQRQMTAPGVYFERCYARHNYTQPWDELARDIHAVGVDNSVLGTDLGQIDQPDPVVGLTTMLDQLLQRGFSPREVDIMACRNPASLLELDQQP